MEAKNTTAEGINETADVINTIAVVRIYVAVIINATANIKNRFAEQTYLMAAVFFILAVAQVTYVVWLCFWFLKF